MRLAPHSRDRNGFVRSAQPCWGMAPPRAHPGCVDGRAARSRSRRGMPRLGRTLASRILVAVLGIVVITMAVGFALFARLTTHEADARAIEQATGIAVTLGRVPEVAQAVQDGDPGHVLARLGEQVRAGTSASYVVIIDRDGIRYSHPTGPDRADPSRNRSQRSTAGSTRGSTRAASAGPPTRGRPSSTPRDARSARCRSASSSRRSASGSTPRCSTSPSTPRSPSPSASPRPCCSHGDQARHVRRGARGDRGARAGA